MVEIRRLSPVAGGIRLRIPPKQVTDKNYRQNSRKKNTERRRQDFPPPTPQPTPCVLWQGPVDRDGYGRRKATRPGSDTVVAVGVHRWIVEKVLGRRLRPDQLIMHLCDNRLCYRHDHLRIGTIQENNADRDAKGRLVHVAQHMHGETNGKSKLTSADVEAIRYRYHVKKESQQVLADEFGVARQSISKIVRGETWVLGSFGTTGETRGERIK